MLDLLITNGKVVTQIFTTVLDVGIKGEKIVVLAEPRILGEEAKRIIDASGLYVLPGAIDPHTHIQMQTSGLPKPGFDINSIAAAYGGTTTLIDFAPLISGKSVEETFGKRRAEAEGRLAIDYAFHAKFTSPSRDLIEEAGVAIEYGVPSFGEVNLDERRGTPADDAFLFALLQEIKDKGGIAGIHAENASLVGYFTNKLLRDGKRELRHVPESRPNMVEEEAVKRTIFLAEKTGAALYFFHLSSQEALKAVAEARDQGFPIYCETCPHYLAFNDEVYQREMDQAIQFVRFPPIRSAADQAALWQGVEDGTIDCIGTDHVSAFLSEKKALSEGKAFNEVPGGMGQIENRLTFMYSEGVAKGRISVNRLVELVSSNPAKVFGLYPQKGTISVGSDADIVLFDPKPVRKVTSRDLHMGLDYTVYEGWTFVGWPAMTIARGKVIIEDGRYVGSLGNGEFLKRRIGKEILFPRRRK